MVIIDSQIKPVTGRNLKNERNMAVIDQACLMGKERFVTKLEGFGIYTEISLQALIDLIIKLDELGHACYLLQINDEAGKFHCLTKYHEGG